MSLLLADLVWRPITGTRWGLAISAAHLLAALLCFRAATVQPAVQPTAETPEGPGDQKSTRSLYWIGLALIMVLLSLNKLFDLQSLITIYGRGLAKDQGWYSDRRTLQVALVAGAAAVSLVGLLVSLYLLRGHWRERTLAHFSLAFLLTLVTIRTTSYGPLDAFLYGLPTVGNRMNAGLELAGAVLVSIGALQALQSRNNSSARNRAA
ncbi:hypothetical protein [Schlesneria sp. T3-172]|uniref:hypothetical protein n=1 Tax=Schlesneria sphaerica TaxID=3373610 RepID=UPI0037C8B1D2